MKKFILILLCLSSTVIQAKDISVKMYTSDNHTAIGDVTLKQTEYGLLLTPSLTSLTPGLHGFHVHAVYDCGKHAMAAGGHYDPLKSNKHLGPYGDGHLGDLPALYVDRSGSATHPVLAPRLTLEEVKHKALMIHQHGDNYADKPKPLGGGGARVACGLID